MIALLALGQRLQEAFVHAGYLVGLRDGAGATAIALIVLYLLTHREARPQ